MLQVRLRIELVCLWGLYSPRRLGALLHRGVLIVSQSSFRFPGEMRTVYANMDNVVLEEWCLVDRGQWIYDPAGT